MRPDTSLSPTGTARSRISSTRTPCAGLPVAKVLNRAGFYVAPTASKVSVALTGARANAGQAQELIGVYTSTDSRAYPLSSYAYAIVPTATGGAFTTNRGRALAMFLR
nr:substrate-binding domain-containing protein [Planosporangium flavigriseum]